ncbi:Ribosomal protein P1B [Spironucleus salmonicida]|uniref:Ribosomal protein P1B n=1 Tax=Spironucleus salmonicida TaxID=348837 RepID=V6LLL6_9EUKA|nr:Ribosomal protein P1B [Spironucleus salmonicida]|eukprot:EST41594.1 Ribosomal protein P1B [Spironucleus salmonicida]
MSAETACVLASIILADANMEVTVENITKIVSAAGVTVPAQWPILFAQYLQGKDINDLLTSIGSGAAAPAAGAAGVTAQAVEKEKTEEEEMVGGFNMDDSSSEDESD